MNRRNALKALAVVVVAPFAALLPRKAKAEQTPNRVGVSGVTYFKVGEGGKKQWHVVHPHGRLFLDGVDVTNRAVEVDLVAGWVVMFDMKDERTKAWPITARVHHGKLEIWDPWAGGGRKVTTSDSVDYVRTYYVTGLTA